MKKSWWLISIAGILCFAVGFSCSHHRVSQSPDPSPASLADSTAQSQPSVNKSVFSEPSVTTASGAIRPIPVPNLIPPTASAQRIPQVQAGRSDPFASLDYTPTVIEVESSKVSSPAAISVAPISVTPPVVKPQPIAIAPPATIPLSPPTRLLVPPVNPPIRQMPPKSAAASIEISGVVQVGGKTNVIVKDPSEQTSRYAAVGERLANGKVLIKRIEMGLEPLVILEQGGHEIVRSIGTSALVGAL